MATQNDSKHTLSAEELSWAADLKSALAAKGIPIPQPDLLLAQFALVGKGNTENAMKRVQKYQKVIEGEYGYRTGSAANSAASGFMNSRWPGSFWSAGVADGHPVLVHDAAKYKPGELKGDEQFRTLVQEWLLIMDACAADLDWARSGVVFVQSNRGVGWSNFSLEMEKRLAPIYQESYPLRFKRVHMVDNGPLVATFISLCKLFLSKKLQERIIACSSESLITQHGFNAALLPPLLGGTFPGSMEEWLRDALARRAESVRCVQIP